MTLKPFKEIVSMTKEKVTQAMAAPRARRLKAQAECEMADLDVEILSIEGKIEESIYCEDSHKNFNFKELMGQLDKIDLLRRRKTQYAKVLSQLFPNGDE